jgi:hypothetical protein
LAAALRIRIIGFFFVFLGSDSLTDIIKGNILLLICWPVLS